MRLAPVPGVTPVTLMPGAGSVERTSAELLSLVRKLRGPDRARDPGLEIAATQAAELAHQHNAGIVAVVEHPDADPAILVAGLVAVERALTPEAAEELCFHLAGTGGIKETARGKTTTGYPVAIVERIPVSGIGAQLQVVVSDPDSPRIAVFTLHSPSGRGWLELAGITGRFVNGVELIATASGTAPVSGPPTRERRARSAPR